MLYIGQYSDGTTSKMRGETLKNITNASSFQIIDTNIPFFKTPGIIRSLGFRYKKGPLLTNINQYIKKNCVGTYDLIWIDKAIFITSNTTKLLKSKTKKLVHFTPDPAFTYHQSKHFFNSLKYYDYVVTTKSFEIDYYKKLIADNKVIYSTQGFDKNIHRPFTNFNEKVKGVTFLGHYEKERGSIIQALIENNITELIAGKYWEKFYSKNKSNPNLIYKGSGIYGESYAKTISQYTFSLGLFSKWIEEKHTTRTFEIPACGTALLTERNSETECFYNDDEVIFYNSTEDLVEKITYYRKNVDRLKQLTLNGKNKVTQGGFDYHSILTEILNKIK